jgi:hypothetical protein
MENGFAKESHHREKEEVSIAEFGGPDYVDHVKVTWSLPLQLPGTLRVSASSEYRLPLSSYTAVGP